MSFKTVSIFLLLILTLQAICYCIGCDIKRHIFYLIVAFCICSSTAKANCQDSTFKTHTDFPYLNHDKKVTEDVLYTSDSDLRAAFSIVLFKFNKDNDSVKVLSKKIAHQTFRKGANDIKVVFNITDTNTFVDHNFYEILKITGDVPPGSYKTYLSIKTKGDTIKTVHLISQDTLLSVNSPVRSQINSKLLPQGKSVAGISLNTSAAGAASGYAKKLVLSAGKLKRAMKFKNLTPVSYDRDNKTYVDFYYKDWFVGRYILDKQQNLTAQINSQTQAASNSISSMAPNDLDDFQSLFSKFRNIKKDKKDNNDITGEISVATNVANGQEEYSGTDDNYYEVTAHVEVPIFDMPVDVDGYYTSQDNHRAIKSSYVHVHYDVDKAKSQLTSLMGSYQQKYAEVASKGAGLQQVYGNYLNTLESQKTGLQNQITAQMAGLNPGSQLGQYNSSTFQSALSSNLQGAETTGMQQLQKDTAALRSKLTGAADSNGSVQKLSSDKAKVKDSVAAKKQKLMELYAKLQKVEQVIQKYQLLLQQYKNTAYFDSVAGAGKFKNFNYTDESSYKDLAKQESNLLPDGKAKTFIAGITNFDAGMFPKEQGYFTMAGQMMKGVDFGYDFKFFKEGITVGKTQYIGADGNVDQYTCYSATTTLKQYKKQQLSFVYYGYTADKSYSAGDQFFKDASVSAPSFFKPVSILSLNYKGVITKYLLVNAEAATSIYQAPPDSNISKDNKAYHADIDAAIPHSTITVIGSYDNAGKGFQNSTLPILPSGTEEYKLTANGVFFKKMFTAGIEYDHFVQNNYAYVGMNNKWGFDLKYNSKKYPTVSLSYKPFTTFTSYSDTLNIPQRPLIGAVWAGKANYRIREKDGASWVFSLLYNKSTSNIDTSSYKNDLLQAMGTYTNKTTMLSASLANITQTGANTGLVVTAPPNMYLLSIMGNYMLTKQTSINGGQDIGAAYFGLCKYSLNGGITYQLSRLPIAVRANLRYTTYELLAHAGWQQLYNGYFEVSWRFKTKMLNRPNL